MGFALFIIYLVLTFVRPGEQDASFRGWELMDVASALALLAAAFAVLVGRGPSFRAVQIPLVFAFATWALVSVIASSNRSETALEDLLGFVKASGAAFVLVMLNVGDSPPACRRRRLDRPGPLRRRRAPCLPPGHRRLAISSTQQWTSRLTPGVG
jgi:hypothetical protein